MGLKPPVEDSTCFMNIPLSAQALWFHLCIRAQWDGLHYHINKSYAKEIRLQLGATDEDVRVLLRNELILDYEGEIFLENVAQFGGPVVCENGVKEVVYVDPYTRLEHFRQRVSEYRQQSVFDFENG